MAGFGIASGRFRPVPIFMVLVRFDHPFDLVVPFEFRGGPFSTIAFSGMFLLGAVLGPRGRECAGYSLQRVCWSSWLRPAPYLHGAGWGCGARNVSGSIGRAWAGQSESEARDAALADCKKATRIYHETAKCYVVCRPNVDTREQARALWPDTGW